jgi:hypothetical protein
VNWFVLVTCGTCSERTEVLSVIPRPERRDGVVLFLPDGN